MLDKNTLFEIFLTLHLLGLAFGLGGVAIADFSLFRTLRLGDRVSPETVAWMRSFSSVIWVGLGILYLSGTGLFLLDPHKYLNNPGFLAKMVFVGILTINGFFVNFYATARLTTFNFSEKYKQRDAAWKVRKLSFIFGAISTTSWYAAFLTAMFKSMARLTFWQFIAIYVGALVCAISFSLVLEQLLTKRKPPGPLTVDQLAKKYTTASLPQFPPPQNQNPPNDVPLHPPANIEEPGGVAAPAVISMPSSANFVPTAGSGLIGTPVSNPPENHTDNSDTTTQGQPQ